MRCHTLSRALAIVALSLATGLTTATAQGPHPGVDSAGFAFWNMTTPPPYRIVRSPSRPSQAPDRGWAPHQEWSGSGGSLPAQAVEPVWRTPYAYGYFGASGRHHWQRHFGVRQSYTQWTLK